MTDAVDGDLVEVRLLGLPLDLHSVATEHHDGVTREFQLIALDPSTAPARLLALGEELTGRYGAFTAEPSEELSRALQRGDATVDLVYRVPRAASDGARQLMIVLDEVDDYCEAGGMLSLATPPEAKAYRRWFLEAFVDQVEGAPPVPWSEYRSGDRS